MKIATVSRKISPEDNVHLAGYVPSVLSLGVHDDLFITGILFDDEKTKAILFNYDLIGIDEKYIRQIRQACSKATGIPAVNIILTCTHTHSGPHTRSKAGITLNVEYLEYLQKKSVEAACELIASKSTEVDVRHYSSSCKEGINRRVKFPDGKCLSLFKHRYLEPIATGLVDDELGVLCFVADSGPTAVIANFAAHPLTCHTAGLAARLISSDYPGVVRDSVMESMGIPCIFTSGACGDIHPRDFETGFNRTQEMGNAIAKNIINSFNASREYKLENTQIKTSSITVNLELRKKSCIKDNDKAEEISLELQFLAIGDICFVGVPGELLAEPGLEIKWHSPFKKTFILYNSTAYMDYICHANAFVGGAYEADASQLAPLAALKIVNATVEELFNLNK